MKNILTFIILLISIHSSNGQGLTIIKYLYTTTEGSSVNLIQYLNDEKSLEITVPKNKSLRDSIFSYSMDELGNETSKVYTGSNQRIPFVYKNQRANQLLLADNLGMNERIFLTDTLNNFVWSFHHNENKQIGKFNCTKATTKFRGRNYIAWFTKDLKISGGPWKFGGLNGLIVEVIDSDNLFKYELTEVLTKQKMNRDITIPEQYEKEKPITYKDYSLRKKMHKQSIESDNRPILLNGKLLSNVKHKLAIDQEL